MRILLIFNPISGRGHAPELLDGVTAVLQSAGHNVLPLATQPTDVETWLKPSSAESDIVVVVGGDGAVRMAASAVANTDSAIYHLPAGTENLFARHFGMTRDAGRLLRAIEHHRVVHVDLGIANTEPFLLMASLGYDAAVVADLAQHRGERITHLSYVMPMLRQMVRWRPSEISVETDAGAFAGRGMLIAANCREYGMHFDPAWEANMTDGLLDLVFFPCSSVADLLIWLARARGRQLTGDHRLTYLRCREARISAEPATHFQLDGDPPITTTPVRSVEIAIRPGCVPVLLPEGA